MNVGEVGERVGGGGVGEIRGSSGGVCMHVCVCTVFLKVFDPDVCMILRIF